MKSSAFDIGFFYIQATGRPPLVNSGNFCVALATGFRILSL